MTAVQKIIFKQLFSGAYIMHTAPDGHAAYTLYDANKKSLPLRRMSEGTFKKIRFNHGQNLLRVSKKMYILNRNSLRKIHKNSWLYKQYKNEQKPM
jgi:hypothetical protein